MIFVDTNILFYAVDSNDLGKQRRAADVLLKLAETSSCVISSQVLVELSSNLVRKLGLSPHEAAAQVQLLSGIRCIPIDVPVTLHALELVHQHRLSIWDSYIVAAALAGGCSILLSEDLQHGARFGPLQVLNPFEIDPD